MKKQVLAIAFLAVVSTAASADDISTRFGPLKIGGELRNELSFKGRRLVRGNHDLGLIQKFRMGPSDVALLQDNVGTGCPALYYFVRVSTSGAKATPAFGTCHELTKVVRKGDRILVTMPGFLGPFEPKAAQAKAARETHVFTYRAGVVTEHGRRVR